MHRGRWLKQVALCMVQSVGSDNIIASNRATQKELILKLKVKTVNKMLAAQEKMKHVGWKFSFFI
jgi:hypothetical protein